MLLNERPKDVHAEFFREFCSFLKNVLYFALLKSMHLLGS